MQTMDGRWVSAQPKSIKISRSRAAGKPAQGKTTQHIANTAADNAKPTAMPADFQRRRLRVGFVAMVHPSDPGAISGMPHHMFEALVAEGVDCVALPVLRLGKRQRARRWLTQQAKRTGWGQALWQARQASRAKSKAKQADGDLQVSEVEADKLWHRATRHSQRLQKHIDQAGDLDVLFGVCISSCLVVLKTQVPLVYASDTTAELINQSYASFKAQGPIYRDVCNRMEQAAMDRCAHVITASSIAKQSAMHDYNQPASQVSHIHFGANLSPLPNVSFAANPPTKGACDLVLVAADPVRKQLDLCIDTVLALRAQGVAARLHVIGPPNDSVLTVHANQGHVAWAALGDSNSDPIANPNANPNTDRNIKANEVDWRTADAPVVFHGRLRLGHPVDAQRYQDVLAASHAMLLPSLAEAFGIAPCEAAWFGKPSLVADVGGLKDVVVDGETGWRLPPDATAFDYAQAVNRWIENRGQHTAMSQAAFDRARSHLNWATWAKHTHAILQQVVADQAAKQTV